jgi:transposase
MAKEILFEKSKYISENYMLPKWFNYKYISENYMLPKWFNYNDIDWVRYYPSKNGKLYIPNSKRTIYITTKKGEEMYICDDEKVKIYSIFVKYLAYLNTYLNTDNDLTDEEIKYKLNITYKQLRVKYYPEKKLASLKKDKLNFYNEIIDKGKNNIISIDESGFYLNMTKHLGRCNKGDRCYKTIHKYPFVKFNFICAIKYGKVIGYKLYEKNNGGIDTDKFNAFYNEFIKDKYKDHLIILDNANFHKSKSVKDTIDKSKNKIIYSLAYNPQCNPIENFFSQLKNHVKNKSPDNYEELKKTNDNIIKVKISKAHLENYFNYLFLQATDFINKNK